jgi:hypothetical protein
MAQKQTGISPAILAQIEERITAFNKKHLKSFWYKVRSNQIYIIRSDFRGEYENTCRLTYAGNLEKLSFAIFRYSNNTYDSFALFPGREYLDGSLEGAMKAVMVAYPG